MLGQKPPMGWNSWNTFGQNINEQVILETADALVEKGFLESGYEYLVIDDCWMLKERDDKNRLVPNPEKFPHGMKYVVDYVHNKGLKFGIYSAAGFQTCMGYPGSFGHEYEDAKLFAEWEVDYVKYDTCFYPGGLSPRTAYLTMSQAIRATGRPMVFSICTVGRFDVWKWAKSIGGHLYRSHMDINDSFPSIKNNFITQYNTHMDRHGAGCFNDFDMLVVGMYNKGNVALAGCNDIEYRTHFALWCYFGVPLMIGADVRTLSKENVELLTNKDLISLDQDEEIRPPYYEEKYVYANEEKMSFLRLLSNGKLALGFFNLSDKEAKVVQNLSDLGIPPYANKKLLLKDIFTNEEFVVSQDFIETNLKSHDCKIYVGGIIDA